MKAFFSTRLQRWLCLLFVVLTPFGGLVVLSNQEMIPGLHLMVPTSPGARPFRKIPRMPMLQVVGDEKTLLLNIDSDLRSGATGPHRRQLPYWIHLYDLAASMPGMDSSPRATKAFMSVFCGERGRRLIEPPELDFEIRTIRLISNGRTVFEGGC